MADLTWEGAAPAASTQSSLQWEGESPSALKWEGEAPTQHDWGTTDARDLGKTNVKGMGVPERKGTWNERRKLAAEEAAAVSPLGRAAFSGLPELNLAKEQKRWLERGEYGKPGDTAYTAAESFIKNQETKAAEKLSNYIATRLSLREDLKEANPGFTESLVGGIQGSLLDPTNPLPLPTKFLKLAVAAGGLGAATSYDQAAFDREIGLLKDDPTIGELLKSGVDTAVIATAFNILGRGMFKGKTKSSDITKPDTTPPSTIKDLEAQVARTKAKAEADLVGPKIPPEAIGPEQPTGYPELAPEFKTIDPLAEQQARMVTEVGDTAPRPSEPLPHIIGDVPADPAVRVASQNYPELDVQQPLADNQFLTGKAQDIASTENVPGIDRMDIARNIPEATIDNTVVPDVTRSAVEGPQGHPIIPALSSKLDRATNIGEALTALASHVPQPLKNLYDAIVKVAGKDIQFLAHRWDPDFAKRYSQLELNEGIAGVSKSTGDQVVSVRGASYQLDGNKPHGTTPTTVLHEVVHSVTDWAFHIARSPELRNKPEYAGNVAYANSMNKLWQEVRDVYEKKGSIQLSKKEQAAWDNVYGGQKDAGEFNSYAWTDDAFRAILERTHLTKYGKSALERVKDLFRKMLGQEIKTVKALDAVDLLMKDLDNIQRPSKADMKIAVSKDGVDGIRFMKDVAEIKDGSELMNYIRNENVGDLGYAIVKHAPGLKQLVDVLNRYFTTTNQTARIFRHPVLLFVAQHIPQIQRQAESRIQGYKANLDTVIKLPRDQQLLLFKHLVDLQKPEFLEARKVAQETGTREALLKEHGMPSELLPEAIKVLDVMQDLYTNEQISAGRFNRGFPEAPMYFPRSHGGTFKFRVIDPSLPKDQQLIFIKGFKSAIEAQKYQTEMAKQLKNNPNKWEISPVERVDVPGYMDSLGDMLIEEHLPDHLKAIVQDINAKSMVSKRKFELERANKDIGGWIGQDVNLADDGFFSGSRKENNRLLDLLNSRIDDSYRFEVNSRIISEIVDPIMHDPVNAQSRPRLNAMLNTIVLRELGYDTSKLKSIVDQPLQKMVDEISQWININAAAKWYDYNPSDIPLVSPHSVKKAVQNGVWLTSAWKLGWNWPVILTNSTAIPLVINDGIRTASKEGIGYHIPALAYQKLFTAPFDDSAKAFMKQAEKEGMITPRAADLFTITDTHGGTLARRTTDIMLNYARNQVEEWTNYISILYYHNFYKLARPDLKPDSEAFKTKVYSAARSHTGDYRSLATPQFITNTGLLGRGSSNFSKWVYNQTGRLLDDLVDIRENPAKFQAYTPLIANMAATVFAGGLYGMAGVADYEFLRMLGQKTGGWDWRPFSAWVQDLNDYAKKNGLPQVPDWMKRGAITEGSEQFVRAVTDGQESGPDVSNTLRHAPFLQANTVMYDTFWNIIKAGLGTSAKKALELAEMGPGLSQQDEKNIAKALPTFMSPLLRDFMKEERIANGKRQFITQAGTLEEGEYAQTNFERRMDLFNLKSKKQNTTTDYKQYQLWQERTKKEKISQLIGATLNPRNLDNKALIAKNVKELVAVGGNAALDNLINQMQDRPFKRLTTYDERLVFSLIQQTDPAARQELIETIKKYQELK